MDQALISAVSSLTSSYPAPKAAVIPVAADAAASAGGPVLLSYRNVFEEHEDVLAKPIFGFAAGSFFMGLAINLITVFIVNHMNILEIISNAAVQREFFTRVAFLLGMTFVGSSLLLVTLKTREDHASAPLHAKTWFICVFTGALYSLCVWGPGMLAQKAIPVNLYAATGFWCVVIAFPVFSSLWMVTREHVVRHTARVVEAVRPIIDGTGNHM